MMLNHTSRGIGQLPIGYQITGSCAGGNYNLMFPDGTVECLSDAQISAYQTGKPSVTGTIPNLPPTSTPAAPVGFKIGDGPSGIMTLVPNSPAAPAVQTAVQQTSNPLQSAGLVATDGSAVSMASIFEQQYGPLPLWGWLAAGAAALFMMSRK